MPDLEIKSKVRLSRKEAGTRLIALGTAFTEGATSEVDFGGQTIRFGVADELEWEFELELDGDETEFEIGLKWSDSAIAEAPAESAHPKANRRRGARAS